MLKFTDIPENKKAIFFELDNVLFPKKDYDLQVYYLFANFIEYLETFPQASEVVEFVKNRYEIHGNQNMFLEISKTFGIDVKYQENLNLLFTNANLPLKLLLFKESLELLQQLIIDRKQLFILTSGNPKTQLNKIKQTEWNGLDKYLKVYFADEYPEENIFEKMLTENNLLNLEVLYVHKNEDMIENASLCGIDDICIF